MLVSHNNFNSTTMHGLVPKVLSSAFRDNSLWHNLLKQTKNAVAGVAQFLNCSNHRIFERFDFQLLNHSI